MSSFYFLLKRTHYIKVVYFHKKLKRHYHAIEIQLRINEKHCKEYAAATVTLPETFRRQIQSDGFSKAGIYSPPFSNNRDYEIFIRDKTAIRRSQIKEPLDQ